MRATANVGNARYKLLLMLAFVAAMCWQLFKMGHDQTEFALQNVMPSRNTPMFDAADLQQRREAACKNVDKKIRTARGQQMLAAGVCQKPGGGFQVVLKQSI